MINKSLLEHEELRPSLCEDPEDSQEGDTDNEATDKVFDDGAEDVKKPEEIKGQPVSLNKGQNGCKTETKTETSYSFLIFFLIINKNILKM